MEKPPVSIHPSALVDPRAQLGVGVSIGPFCIVGPGVQLGDYVEMVSHGIVGGRTQVGAHSKIWPFATIGNEPQDKKYQGEDTELVCGSHNKFREYVNVNVGTSGGGGKTVVGSHNLFMANTHIAHDCMVGDECIFANGVSLGGHVEVRQGAVLGGHAAVHQFCKIGALAMVAGGAIVVQDVPAYVTVHGNHAVPAGLNVIGLRRAECLPKAAMGELKQMYRLIYQDALTLTEAIGMIEKGFPDTDYKKECLYVLTSTTRGICR